MRRLLVLLCLPAALFASIAAAKPHPVKTVKHVVAPASAATTVDHDGWPDTPAGGFGRGYVAAFNSGDEAMKKFYVAAFAPESLAVRGPEKRLVRYHDLRESVGTLTLDHIVRDSSGVLTVSLLDADAASHEFTFTLEDNPPHHLRSITLRQVIRGHEGMGGFHH